MAAPPHPPHHVVPAPASVEPAPGSGYEVAAHTAIHAVPGAEPQAQHLAAALRPATGFALPVHTGTGPGGTEAHGIRLLLEDAPSEVGEEGYLLEVAGTGVTVRAHRPAGLFYGVQTLRQLLPPAVEHRTAQPGPWPVPPVRIVDRPRFGYRGAMLDVARHFFDPAAVRGFIDRMTTYKLNHLHLHLTDDQGWRLAIESWPELTRLGGQTQVGGGPGGYYPQETYRQIVAYARERHITVIPEIDMPGHTNAALSAYPELNRDGVAPQPYTGMKVGFSTLFADLDITYRFVADVLREVAALTPGPYLHIGGDEAYATTPAEYRAFLTRIQPVVAELGKTVLAWQEVAAVDSAGPRVLQYWRPEPPDRRLLAALTRGDRLVLSPAHRTYLDMRYDAESPLGLDWAGQIEVRDAYGWDPGSALDGVPEAAVLGVEAPLWSETISTPEEMDFLAFPRLPALAEVAWSPAPVRDWDGFRHRLAGHGPRWRAAGITFHPSPQIPWS